MASDVEVTEEDREAAWPHRPDAYFYGDQEEVRRKWDAGTYDGIRVVQAFARHRLSALPERDALRALNLARPIVEADLHDAIDHCDADWEGLSRTALDAIDAALKGPEHHG